MDGKSRCRIDGVAYISWDHIHADQYNRLALYRPFITSSFVFSEAAPSFVATKSVWTVCFQNGIDGSDPFPAKYQGNVWEVYAPTQLGGTAPLAYLRSISAVNDGGRWVFPESGQRFPFERPEVYKSDSSAIVLHENYC
jgi:hypothetical protein